MTFSFKRNINYYKNQPICWTSDAESYGRTTVAKAGDLSDSVTDERVDWTEAEGEHSWIVTSDCKPEKQ